MKILSMMSDPDMKPLINAMMSKLGPQIQQMMGGLGGAGGMDFSSMFGGQQ